MSLIFGQINYGEQMKQKDIITGHSYCMKNGLTGVVVAIFQFESWFSTQAPFGPKTKPLKWQCHVFVNNKKLVLTDARKFDSRLS